MVSEKIYGSDLFTNDNIFYIFNQSIYEYDMKEAGFNLIKDYGLLSQKEISYLEKLKKERRTIEIGKLEISNHKLKEGLKYGFKQAREMFCKANDLEDIEIISIKKDAIFVTRRCMECNFLNHLVFREKNYYTSYIRLSRRIELYYNNKKLDVKGLGDEQEAYHRDYIIQFLITFFDKMETENRESVLRYVRRFIDKYKRLELPVDYYRKFDRDSCFELKDGEKFYEYWESNKNELDISYNFFEVFVKLIKIPL